MTTPTVPVRVTPGDYSFTLNGSAQNPLATAYPNPPTAGTYPTASAGPAGSNPNRTHLQFQCPGAAITYSYTNAAPNDPASTLATGCYILSEGQTWGLGAWVPTTPIYINGGAAGSGVKCTLTEC
jgi:hypothetical protein